MWDPGIELRSWGLEASTFTCQASPVPQFYIFLFIPINLVRGCLFFCCHETLLNAFSLPRINLTYFNSQTNLFEVLLSFFHSLVPAFPVSVSYFIKSKIPPSSYWNPSSAPLNLLPLYNTTPFRSLLYIPVRLCYIDQTQCSPLTALDRTLCMYGKQCRRESVYGRMNCCEQPGPKTKPASVANKNPRKTAPCTGSEFQQCTWTGGGVERLMENANPVLSFHRNKPEPLSGTLGRHQRYLKLMKSPKRILFLSDECSFRDSEKD